MNRVCQDAPLLKAVNNEYQDMPLSGYLQFLKEEYCGRKAAPLDPVIEKAVADYATELIGGEETKECIRILKLTGLLYTANHHVVNFHPMTVQGNILFEYLISLLTDTQVVPVFSCSTIPMSNAFYPRGLLIYDTLDGEECKVPVFPYRMRKVSVSHAPVFTKEMLLETGKTIHRYELSGKLSASAAGMAQTILEKVYAGDHLKNCERYGTQVTMANRVLSEGYWRDRKSHHVFLELEEVSRRVICHDLQNDDSILNKLLWNKKLLTSLEKNLNGVSGCWSGETGGTFLFWGIDSKGRAFRLSGLAAKEARPGRLSLKGTDLDGKSHCFFMNRYELSDALMQRKLLPGLFLTFFSLGIARKNVLVGGCLQGEYVRQMCDGVRKSWMEAAPETSGEQLSWLHSLELKRFPYLCGPLFLTAPGKGSHHPLSSVEISEDPLSFAGIKERLEISFLKAQQIGLYCFYPDSVPVHQRADNWWERISEELFDG